MSILNNIIIKIYLIILVVVSILPYHFQQYKKFVGGSGSPSLVNFSYILTAMILLLSMFLVLRSYRKKRWLIDSFKSKYVYLYSIWIVFGQLFGIFIGSINGNIRTVFIAIAYSLTAFFSFYFVPALITRVNSIKYYLKLVMVVGTISGLFGIYASLLGKSNLLGISLRTKNLMPGIGIHETAGIFHEMNIFGLVSIVGFWSSIYFILSSDHKHKLLYYLNSVICLLAVILSWSRAMYTAILLGLVILIIFKKVYNLDVSFKYLYLILIIILLISIAQATIITHIMQLNVGIGGRTSLWSAAFNAIINKPLFGYGFTEEMQQEIVYSFGGRGVDKNAYMGAHNGFLSLGIRGGILLTILYILLIANCVKILIFDNHTYIRDEYTLLRAIILILIVTFTIATTFISYSIGGIGYGALILTVTFGIANNWSKYKIEMVNKYNA